MEGGCIDKYFYIFIIQEKMEIKANSIWINKKNGREYEVIKEAIDCTNERDGLIVVVYICKEVEGKLFVREKEEFLNKFFQK